MKKVLSLLAVAGAFTFAACETKTTETTETIETTTITEPAAESEVPVVTADTGVIVTPDTVVPAPVK